MHRESNLITVQKDASYSVYDDGCQHPKHVELPTECNKLNKSHLIGQLLNSFLISFSTSHTSNEFPSRDKVQKL